MKNTLFLSLDRDTQVSQKAQIVIGTLDVLVSAIVGRLISERLLDYAGQPGQTIECASLAVADELIDNLDKIDQVELKRFIEHVRSEGKK